MFKISEFSKLSQVPAKTLRFYDQLVCSNRPIPIRIPVTAIIRAINWFFCTGYWPLKTSALRWSRSNSCFAKRCRLPK